MTTVFRRSSKLVQVTVGNKSQLSVIQQSPPSFGLLSKLNIFLYEGRASCQSWIHKGSRKKVKDDKEKALRESQKERIKDFDFSYEKLALAHVRNNSPAVDVGSIYQQQPLSHKVVIGAKQKARYLWKEYEEKHNKKGFPSGPEEAKADLYAYLLQKDVYDRMKKIDVPAFCPGSIVAVTRADPFAPKGTIRFVGICIEKNHMDNHPGAAFVLRNVIDGEPLEIRFHTYSPLIQNIEVLKHETRNQPDLKYLRDHPPEESYIRDDYEGVPYTEEPSVYEEAPDTVIKRRRYVKQVFAAKNRAHKDKRAKPKSYADLIAAF